VVISGVTWEMDRGLDRARWCDGREWWSAAGRGAFPFPFGDVTSDRKGLLVGPPLLSFFVRDCFDG
jgi:hypothetical protein